MIDNTDLQKVSILLNVLKDDAKCNQYRQIESYAFQTLIFILAGWTKKAIDENKEALEVLEALGSYEEAK